MAGSQSSCFCCVKNGRAFCESCDPDTGMPAGDSQEIPHVTLYRRDPNETDGPRVNTSFTDGLRVEACPGDKELTWRLEGLFCDLYLLSDYFWEDRDPFTPGPVADNEKFFYFDHCPYDMSKQWKIFGRVGCLENVTYNIDGNNVAGWGANIRVLEVIADPVI